MTVTTPFWFKQRQGTLAEAGPECVRVSGPNLMEAFLGIRRDEAGWSAFMRLASDGPDVAATPAGTATRSLPASCVFLATAKSPRKPRPFPFDEQARLRVR